MFSNNGYYNPFLRQTCPSCGHCPSCGRGGYQQWFGFPQYGPTSGQQAQTNATDWSKVQEWMDSQSSAKKAGQ